MTDESKSTGLLTEITQHLGGIFRHMLPGILVVAGAKLAYPDWSLGLNLNSWQHLFVLAAISLAIGNTWFALNRYGPHQFLDYVLYLCKNKGPARSNTIWSYLDDLGRYTYKSLHTPDTSAHARQHVAFRASAELLALTVGELLLAFQYFHAKNSLFVGHECQMFVGGVLAVGVGFWQMAITRRIDYYIVNPP
jgi:hypothetical protein